MEEMYLVVGHDFSRLYFYLLNKDQWAKYEKLTEENSDEADDFLDSAEVKTIHSCSEFISYINTNNIKLVDGDSYYIFTN